MTQIRKNATIMFTDIVGFTTLMGSDEKRTFEILEKNRLIHKPAIEAHEGMFIKELGDGIMASFNNSSDAVRAAIEIQRACNKASEYQLSIGIHSAEVVFENDDVFGNGVNIAARIQSACPAGCILVSEAVFNNVSNKTDIKSHFVKEEELKNVSKPVRLYQILMEGSNPILDGSISERPEEKSIAVLPFANMSSDPEQEYFSDGISEEIINKIAQIPDLKVIGRTSSFAFKGKNIDLKIIGKELGARYLLEGSVRKSGNVLRITAQLIEAENGFHIYSEKFDRNLEDVFAIQDEISLAILEAIKMKLLVKDKKTLLKKYTDNLEAYELYLRGRYYVNQGSPDAFYRAIDFFDQAIAIDPNYAIAHAEISFCCMNLKDFNWGALPEMIAKGITAAEKSLELDDQIAESHIAYGRILLHQRWQIEKAFETFNLANSINPNSAECHVQLGFCRTLMGDYAKAKKHATRATELEPLSVLNIWYSGILLNVTRSFIEAFQNGQKLVDMAPNFFAGHWLKGFANIGLKKYREAMHCFESASKCNPGSYVLGWLGMAYGLAGEIEKAKEIIETLEKVKVNEPECNHSIASVYASLGKWDSAIKYYNIAIDNKEGQVLWIKKQFYLWYPDFCRDPRALKLYERIGQPDSFSLLS